MDGSLGNGELLGLDPACSGTGPELDAQEAGWAQAGFDLQGGASDPVQDQILRFDCCRFAPPNPGDGLGRCADVDGDNLGEVDVYRERHEGALIEVCGVQQVVPAGLRMLRVGGRYTLAGLVSPGADVTIDANMLVKKWITLKGIHNYHPRHLVQALDFVMANRDRYPFREIVDSKFALDDVNDAFRRAAERSVLRAAVIP